ncbi:dCTP deaminase [Roseateles sp. SL47]|uniref:dCTP deaminase n=1 Tax=Roseateles sp. SL47 TaxID=2995138 RepID=UPI00226F7599|nr:dCTP deaminase [Roseateles sp. SL47]WAC71672.1 dCTP deaminase [Roseateles sp. SL47]
MILTGEEISHRVQTGEIVITPFLPENVNPNSYNFRLHSHMKVYEEGVIDIKEEKPTQDIHIGPEGIVLEPMRLYLASTIETMGSTHFVPTYAARSSIARLGMFINLSASLGDIGFIGRWTIQLLAVNRIRLYAGMNIGQMMFWNVQGDIRLYEGKYQGAKEAFSSRIYMDYAKAAVAAAAAAKAQQGADAEPAPEAAPEPVTDEALDAVSHTGTHAISDTRIERPTLRCA